MIIIVEGIDRVGKSTLCNKLVEKGLLLVNEKCKEVKHNEFRHQLENERIKAQTTLLELIHNKANIVLDRFHLSQYVYGVVNRNIDDVSMFNIDERLSNLDAMLVFVNPVDINRSSTEHGSDLSKHQELFDICKTLTNIPYIETTYYELDDTVRRILDGICS